jgi:hypothetical protein
MQCMQAILQSGSRFRPKLFTATMLICAAVSLAGVILTRPIGYTDVTHTDAFKLAELAVVLSPLLFACSAVGVFFKPRKWCAISLAGGIAALVWFVWTEWFRFRMVNSWIALNLSNPDDQRFILFSKLRILSVAMLVIVIVSCAIRLLPARWEWRASPVCDRTWPALLISFSVVAAWFCAAAVPYRVPLIVDAAYPYLEILHIQKCGIRFE